MSIHKLGWCGAAFVGLLTGCGQVKAPECGDEQTLDLVRSIIQRELGPNSGAASLDAEQLRKLLPISLAHPTSFDEKISRYSCEADLAAPFNNPAQDVYKLRLEYTSQAVNGEHLAEVKVLPGDLMGIGAAMGSHLRSLQEVPAAPSAPSLAADEAMPEPDPEPAYDPAAATTADDYEQADLAEPVQESQAAGPSFNCANATSPVEQMICANEGLARLDQETADAFRALRAQSNDPNGITASQGNWRRSVRDVCSHVSCVQQAYEARLAELH